MQNISFNEAYKIITSILPLPEKKTSVEQLVGRAISVDIISIATSSNSKNCLKNQIFLIWNLPAPLNSFYEYITNITFYISIILYYNIYNLFGIKAIFVKQNC
ncbi:MAG: hypothetical protein SCARUB_03359 [Candidatus Scalindua rubra]|uniref:Uncharacterized protein n=1 Tax=Candidatus Scalindua rubra TaxID=1872076 RepID=A0A1E3X7A2_9BACT|nr:MAG: hypothetical protein SCARUB_03359 [Candidatus Scalindua rubra]